MRERGAGKRESVRTSMTASALAVPSRDTVGDRWNRGGCHSPSHHGS